MTPETIHNTVVPQLYAVLWTIALFLGTISFLAVHNPVMERLLAVFIIFMVFLWETAIMFLDIKAANPGKCVEIGVLGINARLFFILPLAFVLGALYYAFPDWDIIFYLMLPVMGWIKWECVSFSNNIQQRLVDKPRARPVLRPNIINS